MCTPWYHGIFLFLHTGLCTCQLAFIVAIAKRIFRRRFVTLAATAVGTRTSTNLVRQDIRPHRVLVLNLVLFFPSEIDAFIIHSENYQPRDDNKY
jgi:hypothetical protein